MRGINMSKSRKESKRKPEVKKIIHYLRDSERIPFGCVVAISPEMIGVSICNPIDRFSKKRARDIAEGRAFERSLDSTLDLVPKHKKIRGYYGLDNNNLNPIPMNVYVKNAVEYVKRRAKRYFRNDVSK